MNFWVHDSVMDEQLTYKVQNNKNGGAGHRSPYLSHAKRALYHLSYTPNGSHEILHMMHTCHFEGNRTQ